MGLMIKIMLRVEEQSWIDKIEGCLIEIWKQSILAQNKERRGRYE